MPFHGDPSLTIHETARPRRAPRTTQQQQQQYTIPDQMDPNPLHTMQRASKPTNTISSFLNSNDPPIIPTPPTPIKKKHKFTSSKFRGLGCTATAPNQVSVPAAIRASADWDRKSSNNKVKKKQKGGFLTRNTHNNNNNSNNNNNNNNGDNSNIFNCNSNNFGCNSSGSCVVAEDAWCGPGIGFSPADTDCVVVGRRNFGTRTKIDGDKFTTSRERSCFMRRTMNPEHLYLLDSDPAFATTRPESEVFGPLSRQYRQVRHPSPDGLAEIVMLHGGLLMGNTFDRYRAWRLDVDNMTYEQLLELGDKIGYVNTGLKDDEMRYCMRKFKISSLNDLSLHFSSKADRKCSVCQEEYQINDELGKLECGHGFHIECIKQWLGHKNTCPVCKSEAVPRA